MKQDEARIERIYALFDEYRQAYAAEWQRLERCERLYMGEHWHDVPQSDTREPRPVTPVLQSTIENIRADLMDQMPEAIITADDPANERAAQALTEILGENHRRCHYENEYAKLLHDLLIGGYMVQETGFDPHADGGLGGAFLRHADAHNVMIDPMCADIQDSRAVFKFAPYPKEWFKSRYPDARKGNTIRRRAASACIWRALRGEECWRTAALLSRRATTRTGNTRSL